jgi:hypothetical protein
MRFLVCGAGGGMKFGSGTTLFDNDGFPKGWFE